MIRTAEEMKVTKVTGFKDGKGTLTMRVLLNADELHGAGRLFNVNTLEPGASIGKHVHEGDFETYYIISGTGCIDDNGTPRDVKAGDMGYCAPGEFHSITNTGTEDLQFVAVIQYVHDQK
ncbi:MAG: cupin domain-containing protein [Pyramidobacter sp.]|nr:cupin domain-containing protein [Pyramidobacter sp.]